MIIFQRKQERSLSCFLCEQKAVSVCNQKQFEVAFFRFTWCHKPFCVEHGTSHAVKKKQVPDLRVDEVALQKKSIRSEGLSTLSPWVLEKLKPLKEVRMCHLCRKELIELVSLLKVVLITAGALAALVSLWFVVTSLTQPKLICTKNQIESLVLDSCLVRESEEQMRNILQYAEYRTSSKCHGDLTENNTRFILCSCPYWENFDRETFSCKNLTCLYLSQGGQCFDTRVYKSYYNVSDDIQCPVETQYDPVRKACKQAFCPFGFDKGREGQCIQRPEYWELTTQSKYPNIVSELIFHPYRGVEECSKTAKGDKYIPYTDSLGQLQCVHSKALMYDEKSKTFFIPEEDRRPCELHEVLMKFQIGCFHECPVGQRFNFFTRECVP